MGILQPYVGTYCHAASASSKLDLSAILAGCDAVDTEANQITNYNHSLNTTMSYLDANTLSANGKTMQAAGEKCCNDISNVQTSILNTTAQIRSVAESVYNKIQEQMNYEAQVKDQNEINRRSRG